MDGIESGNDMTWSNPAFVASLASDPARRPGARCMGSLFQRAPLLAMNLVTLSELGGLCFLQEVSNSCMTSGNVLEDKPGPFWWFLLLGPR